MPMVGLVYQTEIAVGAGFFARGLRRRRWRCPRLSSFPGGGSRSVISTPDWLVLAVGGQRPISLTDCHSLSSWRSPHPLPGPPTFPTSSDVSEFLVFELLTPCSVPSPGELLPFKGLLSLGEVHLNNLASSEAPAPSSITWPWEWYPFHSQSGVGPAVWGVILEVCLLQWHFL